MIFKKHYSLRLSIMGIFLSTFLFMMLILIVLSSINIFSSMSIAAEKLINSTLHLVLKELSLEIIPSTSTANLSKYLLESNIIKKTDLIDYTLYAAKNLPIGGYKKSSRMVVWGDSRGNSISTVFQTDNSFSTDVLGPDVVPYKLYRNSKEEIIKKEHTNEYYDPRLRPWYLDAVKAKKISWSDLFFSAERNNPTISLSIPMYDDQKNLTGVLTLMTKLLRLSNFLSSLDMGKGAVFIFNSKGLLIAFPGMDRQLFLTQQAAGSSTGILSKLGKPWANQAISHFLNTKETSFNYYYNSENYLAAMTPIHEFNEFGWIIAVVVPENRFTGPLKETTTMILGLCMVILILSTWAISYFSKKIASPIKSLVNETQRIKMLVLDTSRPVDSRIKEVHLLSEAIYSMKMNLRSFEKYIPRKLVRQLIQTGEDSIKGGEERKLTIFFSDIQDFIEISESMNAQEFLPYLSDYLEDMSQIISDCGGTIDKYIGDSIMAFWGAPLADSEQCQHACLTALRCQKKLIETNKKREAQGKRPLITRIGINTGTVLVGNIGSSERLNYTLLGDAVNLASRLDKINKLYHTKIIISEMVVKEISPNFACRLVDRIKVRGKTIGYEIYELLAETSEELDFPLAEYKKNFERGFKAYEKQKWQEAIQAFDECLLLYPSDNLAPIFIHRCKLFMQKPPSKDWDGTWSDSESVFKESI